MIITNASTDDLSAIPEWTKELELDGADLKEEEFLIAREDDELLGFVRIKNHQNCQELATLGVLTHHQKKGIGAALINAVIEKAEEDLYLVTIIPEYFSKHGFQEVKEDYPDLISKKHQYCSSEFLHEGVPYVVMKYSD